MVRAVVTWIVLRCLSPMPIFRYTEVQRCMCLHSSLYTDSLCDPKNVVLHMAWLHLVGIACYKRHIFAFLILQADFPTTEKLWSGLDVRQFWILGGTLELSADNILQTVVRNDMVVCTLIFDRDRLLHQATFLELVAIDQ